MLNNHVFVVSYLQEYMEPYVKWQYLSKSKFQMIKM